MSSKPVESGLKWTDQKNFLIELIYCIHAAKSVNEGKVTLKELVKQFESFFNVELHNFSDAFGGIVKRGENRCKYIVILLENLQKLLFKSDSRQPTK